MQFRFLLFLLPPVLAVILSFAMFACSCGSACGSGYGEGGVVITVTFLVSVFVLCPVVSRLPQLLNFRCAVHNVLDVLDGCSQYCSYFGFCTVQWTRRTEKIIMTITQKKALQKLCHQKPTAKRCEKNNTVSTVTYCNYCWTRCYLHLYFYEINKNRQRSAAFRQR